MSINLLFGKKSPDFSFIGILPDSLNLFGDTLIPFRIFQVNGDH